MISINSIYIRYSSGSVYGSIKVNQYCMKIVFGVVTKNKIGVIDLCPRSPRNTIQPTVIGGSVLLSKLSLVMAINHNSIRYSLIVYRCRPPDNESLGFSQTLSFDDIYLYA